jgi:GAF domain-containing protein
MAEKTTEAKLPKNGKDSVKKQLAQREAELAIISSVSEAISKQLNIDTIIRIIGDKVRDIFKAEVTEILLLEESTNIIQVPYSFYRDYQEAESFHLGEGLTSKIIQSGKPLVLGTFEESVKLGVLVQSEEEKTETYIGVPIIVSDKVIGVVSIQSYKKFDYNDEKVRLLSIISTNMGVALQNAKLFDETKRLLNETAQREAELTIINSVGEAMSKQLDVVTVTKIVGDKVREIFGAEVTEILLLDHESGVINVPYSYYNGYQSVDPFKLGAGLTSEVINSRKPLLLSSFEEQNNHGAITDDNVGDADITETYLGVPILFNDKILGVVSIQSYQKNAYDDNNVRLLSTLSTNMGVTLQNAKLFEETKRLLTETEQRTAELAIINSVGDAMSKELDINTVTKIVGDKVREIFHTEVTEILLLDHEKGIIEIPYSYYNGYRTFQPFQLGEGLTSKIINSRKPLLLNNIEDQIKQGAIIQSDEDKTESYMGVPILFGEKVLGVVSIQSYQQNAYNENNVRLLSTLSANMGIALQNARLFDGTNKLLEESKQQAIELGIINSVGEGLAKQLDFQAIVDLVGEKIREVFNAQVVSISTYNSDNDTIHHRYVVEKEERYYFDQPIGIDPDRKEIVETKRPLIFGSSQEIIEHSGEQVLEGEMPESFLGVPIIHNQTTTGIITIQDLDRKNLYSEKDGQLLLTLASNMGVALENARLFEETKRLLNETQQRNVELAILNAIQEGLVMEMNFNSIINLVGDKFREALGFLDLGIRIYDKENNILHFPYEYEHGEKLIIESGEPTPFSKYVLDTGKMLLIKQNNDEEVAKLGFNGQITIPGTDRSKSLVMVPIMLGNEARGLILIENYEREDAFSESEVRLLTTVANSMSVALENARLFDETNRLLKETKQRTAELSVINSVQEGLASELDIHGIYELVGEKIREIFNAQVIDIVTYDNKNGTIADCYSYEKGDRTLLGPRPLKGFRKHVIETVKPLVINKDNEKESIKYDNVVVVGEVPKSLVLVPMVAGEEVTGVISLQNLDSENAFSDSDVRLLTTLANSMSVAIENARLFDETNRLLKETEQRTAELAVINSVQEGLAKELDMHGIYNLVGDRVQKLFNAQVVIIATLDTENKIEHFNYFFENDEKVNAEPRPLGKLRLHLIKTRKKIIINTQEEGFDWFGTQVVAGTQPIKSAVFVPLIIGDKITSYVSLQNIDKENAFSDSDIRLLETLSNSMSVALENARLFDETNRLLKETEQRTAELAVINSVQEGLAKELDMHGIYNLVGDRLCSLFPDSQTLVIRTFNLEEGLEEWQYAVEKGIRLEVEPRPFNWANKLLIETKKPLDIRENYVETAQKYGGTGVTKGQPPKSAVFVPMIAGDLVKGSISLQNVDRENAFSDSDVRLVTTVVNSMSVALQNARLFDETLILLDDSKKRAAELSTVNSISQAIVGHLEIDKLINLVGDKVRDLFKANIVYLALLNKENNMIEFPYGYGEDFPDLELGNGLTSKIIIEKLPLLLNTEVDKKTEQLGVRRIGVPSASYLGVPIPVGDEIIGVLSVQSTENENVFNEDDMRLLGTIAAHVGIAINNANAYKELNKTLENLQATQDQLIAQEKLASLGQLTAGIAHEIKNPLNFVNNFSELSIGLVDELRDEFDTLREKLTGEDLEEINDILNSLKQNSEKIKEHGKRADSIVHSMLQHSRGKTGEKQLTDINAMLDEDLNLVFHGMRAQDATFNIKIEREYDAKISKINVIPQDISRVFLNVLTNGCYEAHRKKLEMKTDKSAEIRVKTLETDKHIEIRIRDNGNGIPEKIKGDLFTPFFTTKPTGKGTGLGLSISYDIVAREHQGELLFESEEGKFTEFIIRLPKNLKN